MGILAPGFFLALIGVVWQRRGLGFPLDFVTNLVINVSMPALLFHTLVRIDTPVISLGQVAIATVLVHAVFAPVAMGMLVKAGSDWRLSVAHVVGNTGNLGLPVCYFAFGETGLAYAMTFFAVQCLLLFSVGEAVYAGRFDLSRVFRSPILIAIMLALLARSFGVAPPEFAMETLELLGQITIPLMLITLGVSLSSMRASSLPSTVAWSIARTGVAIVVGFGIAHVMDLEGAARGVVVIQTVVPVAVFNFLLAVRHSRDSEAVAGLVLVTHLGALFYLPIVLGILIST